MDKDYLLEKWLNGNLTDTEKVAFSKLDDALYNQYIIDVAQHFKVSDFSEVKDFNTFKKHYNNIQKSPVKSIWLQPLLKIASIIIIGLGLYFAFFFNQFTQIETLANEKTTIELPDNSKVELNALTQIQFNEKNWEEKRVLKLDGEAYFKVAKGSVFDVVTNDGIVTVVGTEFNVKQRKYYFEVKCFEGVVKVKSDTIIRQLLAGDIFKISNGKFTESKTTSAFPEWTRDISSFEAVPFREIIAELERQYNIKVEYKGIDINRLFTGGFTHNELENALISITQPMDLTFELRSNLVIIHGKEN